MKRIASVLCAALIVLALCAPMFTASAKGEYVVDGARLLTDEQISNLTDSLEKVSKRTDLDVVVVTTVDLDGKSIEDFADDYYDYNGYKDDGCVLVYYYSDSSNLANNDAYISTKGDGIKVLDDDAISDVGSKVRPHLNAGEYYEAFDAFAKNFDKKYDEAKQDEMFHLIFAIAACFVIGLIIALIVVAMLKSSYKPVRLKAEANDYLVKDSLNLKKSHDLFLYTHVTRTRREKSSSGGSSTHTSSSGSSHGGGHI